MNCLWLAIHVSDILREVKDNIQEVHQDGDQTGHERPTMLMDSFETGQGDESDYLLLDVRQPEEYTEAHIPCAKLVPLLASEERLDEIPENRDVVFYRHSGKHSQAGALFAADRCFQLMELSLSVEYGAYDLHQAMAERSEEEETREAFWWSVAQPEKGHMRTITKAIRMSEG